MRKDRENTGALAVVARMTELRTASTDRGGGQPPAGQAAAGSCSQWLNKARPSPWKAQLAHSPIALLITLLFSGLPFL